ncbi:hypothetical protein [Spirosoma areae]
MLTAFSGQINARKWILLLSGIPILIFFYTFFLYINNIPFQDDYDALLEPVIKFKQMAGFSWSEFVRIIWTQDDERRIVVDRLAAIFSYLVIGQLDLRLHTFLGLLSLSGLFYLIYTIIRDAKLPLVLVLVSSFLLFHIQYYEAIFWPMIPFQHIIVYFFALLAAFFLSPPTTKHFLISLAMAILAILSDVSGIFILPVGVALLLLQHRWKHTLLWVLVIGSMVALYYYNLVVPAFRPKPLDNLQHPGLIITIFLAFSGLFADAGTALPSSLRIGLIVIAGTVLWGVVIYNGVRRIQSVFSRSSMPLARWEVTLWGGILHLGITMLAFSVGRALDGVNAVLISRYKHMGFLWLILIILLVSGRLKPMQAIRFSRAWLVVSFVLFLFSYFQYLAPLDYYYKERNTDIYGWQYNRAIPSTPIYLSVKSYVDTVTVQAVREGVYQLPERYFFDGPYQQTTEAFPLTIQNVGGHTLSFSNDSFVRKLHKYDGAYLILKSITQQHILPVTQRRSSLKSFLFSFGSAYYSTGFETQLVTSYIQPNQVYTVSVLVIEGDRKIIHPTTYEIRSGSDSVTVVKL